MEQHYGLIELFVIFGIVLALLVYELISVRRSLRESAKLAEDLKSRNTQHHTTT